MDKLHIVTTQIDELNAYLSNRNGSIIVLCDENTYTHCYPLLCKLIQKTPSYIVIKAGEAFKNIETCSFIWQQLMELNADKSTLLINLGGGVVSDIGGFAASTYKRGISFMNIPTTLLAMVDAALGGKTGVNFNQYKNIIGLIQPSDLVYINTEFLNTLPAEQIENGQVEMLKHALISNEIYTNELVSLFENKQQISSADILKSIAVKQDIVNQDLHETGIRKVLNFGHTIGHGIEYAAQKNEHSILHGHAVALGMMVALNLSVQKLGFDATKAMEISSFLKKKYPVPNWLLTCKTDIIEAIKHDKKNANAQINMVLLKSIGEPVFDIACSLPEIEQVLNLLMNKKA